MSYPIKMVIFGSRALELMIKTIPPEIVTVEQVSFIAHFPSKEEADRVRAIFDANTDVEEFKIPTERIK